MAAWVIDSPPLSVLSLGAAGPVVAELGVVGAVEEGLLDATVLSLVLEPQPAMHRTTTKRQPARLIDASAFM
jgi:hypothetical protein